MMNVVKVKRALLSVSDKRDLIAFARALEQHGVEIISTGGTARTLSAAGVKVVPVENVTGFPEMMDGRLKTLHPAVHGALLGRRDVESHVQAMTSHDITPIDLICVNLYPFERTLKEDLTRDEAIELIDIGGPAMIRSAAKNHDAVTVVTNPSQYDRVASELEKNKGGTTLELRRDLAAAAFSRTAEYDAAISAWMCGREATSFPAMLRVSMIKQDHLRYGENPHQQAALYADPAQRGANVVSASMLHGKQLSYNNLNDAAAAFELVRDLRLAFPDRAGAAVIKHTNPCGCALGESAALAFERAYAGDSLAAFGGILACNREIDGVAAERIVDGQKFLEVIIAPSFSGDAVTLLAERWANVRLLATGPIEPNAAISSIEFRSIPGGLLMQQRDQLLPDTRTWQHVAGPVPDDESLATGVAMWIACKHLKSNAIAVGADGMLLGAGAGQMDRVTSARLAVEKAGDRLQIAATPVAASDGFFPFADGPKLLIDHGVKVIVQPGGSKRDGDTVELCRNHDTTLLLTGVRHFKH